MCAWNIRKTRPKSSNLLKNLKYRQNGPFTAFEIIFIAKNAIRPSFLKWLQAKYHVALCNPPSLRYFGQSIGVVYRIVTKGIGNK